ncbi:MAG: hypothetical protein ABSB19_20625 [Methylomonas sp.]|jgi:hypothetical protein
MIIKIWLRWLLKTGLILTVSACSVDGMKEIAYTVGQNFGAFQCQKILASECKPQISYDAYQRQLKDIEQQR